MYECLFGRAPYSSSSFKELVQKIQLQAPIKAVALIKQAIELDGRGHLSQALSAYTSSLRLLVPCACAERDRVRRAALTDKLTRYAVALIKQDIELDGRGHLYQALSAYTSSLRLLVPCACAERDRVRRAALTDKLTRYVTNSLASDIVERREVSYLHTKRTVDVRLIFSTCRVEKINRIKVFFYHKWSEIDTIVYSTSTFAQDINT
ncbi:putative cAMP-dependent protein kinase catalytic subunit [Operophtera brumata]|uniref:Putative cAMP-dependent protein kinase catalytic subunit n=1 Tax=Operophtera brumata TaxID=104452 RepID=A0A0L7L1F8_OPEBR|nr:putative cAMP-dependent protein kinase catalytic subunit [Operophtera brumata]